MATGVFFQSLFGTSRTKKKRREEDLRAADDVIIAPTYRQRPGSLFAPWQQKN